MYHSKKNESLSMCTPASCSRFSANCNRLINQASGEFVAIYHADDVYDKLMVEKQQSYLNSKKHLAGVFTLANIVNSKGELLKKKLFTLNSLIHRPTLQKTGGSEFHRKELEP